MFGASPPEPAVSVVVPVRNVAGSISGLLDALAAQTLDGVETVVVDDASTDDTAAAVAQRAGVRLVRRGERGGSYAARNDGVAAARASLVAFTDADCRPEPCWLQAAVGDLQALGTDLLAGHVEVPLSARPTIAEALDVARFLDQEESVARAAYGATANLVVRRAVFDALGGFDARLTSGGDVELCARAQAAGLRIAYSPRARVVHHPRTRARALTRKALRVGVGVGQMRRHGIGPWGARRPPWTMPGAWRPAPTVQGAHRWERRGYRPRRARVAVLVAGQYVLIHVPMLLGQIAGRLGSSR